MNTKQISARMLLERAVQDYHPRLALACSFSMEDIVIAHMLSSIRPDAGIFAIDTGRLNPETYECAEEVRRKLGIKIKWYFPLQAGVEQLESESGLFSFRNSLEGRHECCNIRKVEPLKRALAGLNAWITGRRADQGETRSALTCVELDEAHNGIMKINPLADWSSADVETYALENQLPGNRLLAQGYKSIGCAPCTRAVKPGEHERAGRWWWESPEHKECGLHIRGL